MLPKTTKIRYKDGRKLGRKIATFPRQKNPYLLVRLNSKFRKKIFIYKSIDKATAHIFNI